MQTCKPNYSQRVEAGCSGSMQSMPIGTWSWLWPWASRDMQPAVTAHSTAHHSTAWSKPCHPYSSNNIAHGPSARCRSSTPCITTHHTMHYTTTSQDQPRGTKHQSQLYFLQNADVRAAYCDTNMHTGTQAQAHTGVHTHNTT